MTRVGRKPPILPIQSVYPGNCRAAFEAGVPPAIIDGIVMSQILNLDTLATRCERRTDLF
jgi:hypothetical protein